MKPKIHVMLCDDIGERFFGEGPCRLLHRIEETGSLRAAAQAMGLSYSKALRMVKRAEKDPAKLKDCYEIGRQTAEKELARLTAFIKAKN